jgi:hypothetical protein
MEPSRNSGAALADPDRLLADIARHLGALVFAVWMAEMPNRLAILRTASGFFADPFGDGLKVRRFRQRD